MIWIFRHEDSRSVEYDRTIQQFKDVANRPSVDAVLSFDLKERQASIYFQQVDDEDGTNETSFEDRINVTWDEAMRLIKDSYKPEVLSGNKS